MCGIIGIIGNKPVSRLVYHGLFSIQHRGQSSAGKLTYDGNIHVYKDAGLVRDVFNEDKRIDTPGFIGIGHTRYSTAGMDDIESLKKNAQPEYLVNPFLAAVHNGNIYNCNEVAKTTNRKPRTDCDIQWLLLTIADNLYKKELTIDTIIAACNDVIHKVKGSYSVLFIADSGDHPYLFALTDPRKIRPLVLGKANGYYCLTSETRVFKKINFEFVKDIPGGSVIVIDKDGNVFEKQLIKKPELPCMFEYVYFAKPDSRINGRSVHKVRTEIGRRLAREHPVDADIVIPVPESGRRYALGYSRESGIMIDEGIMKDKAERSFIQQTQEDRDKIVEEGLSFLRSVLDGKKVILVDDSIVRGTNIRKIVSGIRKAGADEIHIRIGCPPLIAPCYLGIDMRSRKEFLARDVEGNIKKWDDIAKEINADSLGYISINGLRDAIGFDICRGCIDFPKGYPPEMREDVTKLFGKDRKDIRAYECL
ncbi:MAG: amidophosphoribosyltransferase [Candidatus Thermoplasmatota archaeon]|nr:amidophosphoribosyltransferase [Candidatus Thermoplasmatota archaeon]MBU1941857.1 amidophosphoribosyltransferase [Candidatus Thermoplasmatota archaeon]